MGRNETSIASLVEAIAKGVVQAQHELDNAFEHAAEDHREFSPGAALLPPLAFVFQDVEIETTLMTRAVVDADEGQRLLCHTPTALDNSLYGKSHTQSMRLAVKLGLKERAS